MTMLPLALAFERAMPFVLFTLYLITSVQVCRYGAWIEAGAPNPFLPRRLKRAHNRFETRMRAESIA